MAYFPNGTAQMEFDEAECEGCVHREDCSVAFVHLAFNYDQIQDGKLDNPLAEVLSALIDDSEPLGQMCTMRIAK